MKVAGVEWHTSVRVSAVHALWAVCKNRQLSNRDFERLLRLIVDRVKLNGSAASLDWDAMIGRAFGLDASDELVVECEIALSKIYPDLAEQLRLRIRPIQEQWETCGLGLLRLISEILGVTDVSSAASNVVLVQPVIGGNARAYPRQELVVMEAVLANATPELPETLRLAWGMAQLISAQASIGHGNDHPSELQESAVIPVCLAAAEALDLVRLDKSTVELATKIWLNSDFSAQHAEGIMDWWLATEAIDDWAARLKVLAERRGLAGQ